MPLYVFNRVNILILDEHFDMCLSLSFSVQFMNLAKDVALAWRAQIWHALLLCRTDMHGRCLSTANTTRVRVMIAVFPSLHIVYPQRIWNQPQISSNQFIVARGTKCQELEWKFVEKMAEFCLPFTKTIKPIVFVNGRQMLRPTFPGPSGSS